MCYKQTIFETLTQQTANNQFYRKLFTSLQQTYMQRVLRIKHKTSKMEKIKYTEKGTEIQNRNAFLYSHTL